jgi:hypothetical protein
MPRRLTKEDISRYYGGLPVVDAERELRVFPNDDDIAHGDPRDPENCALALHTRRGYTGGPQLTPSPEDAPETYEGPRREWPIPNTPARCWGCHVLSGPRPMGDTPAGWSRDADGQGRYWCPDCRRNA